MTREEILDVILTALDNQMIFTKQNMEEHPGLGYGQLYDKLHTAKQYLKENLK